MLIPQAYFWLNFPDSPVAFGPHFPTRVVPGNLVIPVVIVVLDEIDDITCPHCCMVYFPTNVALPCHVVEEYSICYKRLDMYNLSCNHKWCLTCLEWLGFHHEAVQVHYEFE